MAGRLFNLRTHVIVTFNVKHVGDEIKCMVVVLDFYIEAGEIEAIGEVVFINFAKVFVAF